MSAKVKIAKTIDTAKHQIADLVKQSGWDSFDIQPKAATVVTNK